MPSVGLIHVGDELREVNGIPVDDKKPEEIIHILVNNILKLIQESQVIVLKISDVFLSK